MKKKAWPNLLLCAALILLLLPASVRAASAPDTFVFDVSEGDITITAGTESSTLKVVYGGGSEEDNISSDQAITLTGSTEEYTVTVEAGVTAKIALSNLSIDLSAMGGCPFDMAGAAVHLMLTGDNTLTAGGSNAGLRCPAGASLTITNGTGAGTLAAFGGSSGSYDGGAGIGGGANEDGGAIAMLSGTVTAREGAGAGIGGGSMGNGGVITISGGTVTVDSTDITTGTSGRGASIGGGYNGNGGTITISGGRVTANNTGYGAGIGGGFHANSGTITISGGNVTVWGFRGAGIGGGASGDSDSITISGGTIEADGFFGAGIGGGGGGSGDCGSVIISGGMVTAVGEIGAGIGGGQGSGKGGAVVISGGTVKVAGGPYGGDIGGTSGGDDGTLEISGDAAVFLRTNGCPTPVTAHTRETITGHTAGESVYGIPVEWDGDFGAYLRLFTLSYDANGGDGAPPAPVTQHVGTRLTLAGPGGLNQEGMAFAGWNTQPDGEGDGYAADDPFVFPLGGTVLYARWAVLVRAITISPSTLDFGSKTAGYAQSPPAQTVTVTNSGELTVTLTQPSGTDYEIGALSQIQLAPDETATFTVRPKTGLSAGDHHETLSVGDSEQVEARFTVTPTEPGPDDDAPYIFRTLTDGATGTTVSGIIHRDAALTVNNTVLHAAGTCAACDAIRSRMADSNFITLIDKDISLSLGFRDSLTITIPVGTPYNGETVTILHCANGTPETFAVMVEDGKATFTVTGLSPFAVFVQAPNYDLPSVVTNSVPEVSDTSARLFGNVAADGGAAVTERGFVYGDTPNLVIGGAGVAKVAAGNGTGSFTAVLTGLEPNTAYYVRAYAVSSAGTAYGAAIRFLTDEDDLDDIPKTGDFSSPWIWWLLCGVSAAGITALAVLGRRRKADGH